MTDQVEREDQGEADRAEANGPSSVPVDPFTAGSVLTETGPNESLIIDIKGYEGPLDLLLEMARTQKVGITQISILALVEQYLEFIAELRRLRLELAADYLVMAAWLAYLKSRLLLPDTDNEEEPSGEELAAALAFRLRRLEAMRESAVKLMTRNRLGRDVFERGAPEGVRIERTSEFVGDLYDLLKAYAFQREAQIHINYKIPIPTVLTLNDAKEILTRLIGEISEWTPLDILLAQVPIDDVDRGSTVASTFGASLELAREGIIELRQAGAFTPLYMRDGNASKV